MIGSGGLVVMDDHTCMVEVARFFMNFTQNESCGKCVPCREGTKRMLEILERIVAGNGKLEDLDLLEELANMITETALCGLGKSAALPVMSTLKVFHDEYVEHVVEKKCASHTCTALRKFIISPERCKDVQNVRETVRSVRSAERSRNHLRSIRKNVSNVEHVRVPVHLVRFILKGRRNRVWAI